MSLNAFFDALTGYEKAYFIVAIFGTIFFLMQTLFTFLDIGDSFEIDADFDGEIDTDLSFLGISMPFHLFTIRGIIGFILVFGWSGFGFSKAGATPLRSLLLAVLFGFIMMFITALIYYGMEKLSSEGNVRTSDAIGRRGKVYLTIPKENSGIGKVHLVINGSLRELDARTEGDAIPTGEEVEVVAVAANGALLVKKIERIVE